MNIAAFNIQLPQLNPLKKLKTANKCTYTGKESEDDSRPDCISFLNDRHEGSSILFNDAMSCYDYTVLV